MPDPSLSAPVSPVYRVIVRSIVASGNGFRMRGGDLWEALRRTNDAGQQC